MTNEVIYKILADTNDVLIREAYINNAVHLQFLPKPLLASNSISINLDYSGATYSKASVIGGGSIASSESSSSINGFGSLKSQISASGGIDLSFSAYGDKIKFVKDFSSLSVNGKKVDISSFESNSTLDRQEFNNLPTGLVTISGDFKEGKTLTISNSLSDLDGLGEINYQWFRDGNVINDTNKSSSSIGYGFGSYGGFFDSYGGYGNTASNSSKLKHLLTATDVGKIISVKATYTDLLGTTESVFSNSTTAIKSIQSTEPTNGNDLIIGTDKKDKLTSLAGNDTIVGGLGADKLTGGLGADIFKYTSVKDSGTATTSRDTITDFKQSEGDKIDISEIYAQVFTFIGSAAFSKTDATGQLRFDLKTAILYGSTNNDNKPEFSILLSGVKSLVVDDFVL